MKRRGFLAVLAMASWSHGSGAELAQYLVTLEPGADERTVREAYGRWGIKTIKPLPDNVYLVTMQQDPGLAEMEKARRGDARIRAVQPNQRYRRY